MIVKPKINAFHFVTNMTRGIPWHWIGMLAEWASVLAIVGIIFMSAAIVLKLRQAP